MDKQQQFLWIAQTEILANAINLSSRNDWAEKQRHLIGGIGVGGLMADAVRASAKIPAGMEAEEAANEFCGYMLSNLRETTKGAEGRKLQVPYWFALG